MRTLKPNIERPRLDFVPQKFKDKTIEKGYDITWEKMLLCPCRKDITTQAKSDCINCNGTGYHWFDPIETIGLISSVAVQKRFLQWTEDLMGTAMMTINPEYKIGWMDKITVNSAETMYSEVCEVFEQDALLYIRTKYIPLEVIGLFEFVAVNEALNSLENQIETNGYVSKILAPVQSGDSISILYKHRPVYLVNDTMNDYRNTYVKKGMIVDTNKTMPIRVMIKKAHLLL